MSFLSLWLPPAAWCGLIFYLSSIPGLSTGWGVWDLILRKCAHMFVYGVLTLMMVRALRRTFSALTPTAVRMFAAIFSVLYAISDEYHQGFVPGRTPAVHDVVIDSIGVAFALLFLSQLAKRDARRRVVAAARHLILLALVLPLVGCGAEAQFKRAKSAEKAGRAYEAWEKYQEFAARHPDNVHAAKAVFRAGFLAENVLGDCTAAKTFYVRVETAYPGSQPWSKMAVFEAANCPDFFPLVPGSTWVEGDSESGGRNARIDVTCRASSGTATVPLASGILVRDYFGGSEKFKTTETLYRKDGATVWEVGDGPPRAVLRGPLEEGASWDGDLAGRTFHYEIVSSSRSVTVRAGTFAGCIQVRSTAKGVPGSTNEYYAPFVGRVLTTLVSDAGEHRSTELLSYKTGDRTKILP